MKVEFNIDQLDQGCGLDFQRKDMTQRSSLHLVESRLTSQINSNYGHQNLS